jgi:hypothetical protein
MDTTSTSNEMGGLERELLLEACLISEVKLQCIWAAYHLGLLRERIAESRRAAEEIPRTWDQYLFHHSMAFAEVQAFLVCAAIVDSIVSGGMPPRKGLPAINKRTRSELRRRLSLDPEFHVPGRAQRNGLIHIPERIIEWSRPVKMRADFATGIHPELTKEQLSQVLRALDFDTLEFAVVGERCRLTDIESALKTLGEAARAASKVITEELNAIAT